MKRETTLLAQNIVSSKQLVKLDFLKACEKVFPTHLEYIKQQIIKDNAIHKPLIVDKKHHIVLDGSHRYAFLKSEGFTYAPVILVDYESSLIQVGSHLIHRFINQNSSTLSKKDIITAALTKELFHPRTTRHFFPFRKQIDATPLEELVKTDKKNINSLLSKVEKKDEIAHNQNYIHEIDCELEVIQKYIEEQLQTKTYLTQQIRHMSK